MMPLMSDLRSVAANGDRPLLVTIPLSHYCEKARWALEYAAVEYTESPHAPGLHARVVRRLGGDHATPLLVTRERAIHPSAAILDWVDTQALPGRRLYPENREARAAAKALEARFDEVLGPHARRIFYFDLLSHRATTLPLWTHGVPAFERLACGVAYPLLCTLIRRSMRIDASGLDRSVGAVLDIFREVEDRLADGRQYLCGDRFTGADLSFAALAAPLVFPAEYSAPLPPLESLPRPAAGRIRAARETVAGEFALRLFRERRR